MVWFGSVWIAYGLVFSVWIAYGSVWIAYGTVCLDFVC
jgi:hypothetical protein